MGWCFYERFIVFIFWRLGILMKNYHTIICSSSSFYFVSWKRCFFGITCIYNMWYVQLQYVQLFLVAKTVKLAVNYYIPICSFLFSILLGLYTICDTIIKWEIKKCNICHCSTLCRPSHEDVMSADRSIAILSQDWTLICTNGFTWISIHNDLKHEN